MARPTVNPESEILPFPNSQHIMTGKYLKDQKAFLENKSFFFFFKKSTKVKD